MTVKPCAIRPFWGFCRVGPVGDDELLCHELMVEVFNTGVRRNNQSLRVGITGVVALLISLTPASALNLDVYSSPELRHLLDGKLDPLPAVPLSFPQFDKRKDLDDLIKGQIPVVFQISQANGEYADPAKVAFFQIVGAHYFLRVGFIKIAANSEAAWALYDRPVTKPVYIIFDPTKVGPRRFKIWDESEVGDMDQNYLEAAIKEKLGFDPILVSPEVVTAANEHKVIFDDKADWPNPGPTATWITILFYSADPALTGAMNRLRDELGLARFFYIGRMRFAEVDLSNESAVYQTLTGDTPSKDGELIVYDPASNPHRFVRYVPGSNLPGIGLAPPLAELTHPAFIAWLQSNAVEPPEAKPLSSDFAWQQLILLARSRQLLLSR
jgi:hypothetical protein